MAKSDKRESEPQEVTLIVAGAPTGGSEGGDRGGGELQSGAVARFLGFGKITKSVESMRGDMEKVAAAMNTLVDVVGEKKNAGMSLKEVEVALAISAEGTIGFATAGVETSFTLKFSKG